MSKKPNSTTASHAAPATPPGTPVGPTTVAQAKADVGANPAFPSTGRHPAAEPGLRPRGSKSRALSLDAVLLGLKAAAEPTRLRILALLDQGDLNVSDLTRILGQSQPRISRHLKLLVEAGLIERFREGSWMFFRLSDSKPHARLTDLLICSISGDDPWIARDRVRADEVKRQRSEHAQAYFRANAAGWDTIRRLHVADEQVEAALSDALGSGPFELLVDLGTGTGRMLEIFSNRTERGIGIDVNHDMLAVARSNLERAEIQNCHVRAGDIYHLPLDDGCADAVLIHQVLHYLDEPAAAIAEAARLLRPGGRLLIVDFAPHEFDFLRDQHAHQRLGFPADQLLRWLGEAGLTAGQHRNLEPVANNDPEPKLTVSLWSAVAGQAAELRTADTNRKTRENMS